MLTLNKPGRYVAYLLRCWVEQREDAAAPPAWRFSLEDPHTGRRRGFASLEQLVAALVADCSGAPPTAEPTDTAPAAAGDTSH